VAARLRKPIWFQLYVLKDRAFMRDVMRRAGSWARHAGLHGRHAGAGQPLPRPAHSGMSGASGPLRRMLQAMVHPRWAWDVGLHGRPHDLGNITAYRGQRHRPEDYIGWLGRTSIPASLAGPAMDPRRVAGQADPEGHPRRRRRARRAGFGADGIVVSNHGGRQLDGALSTASVLPAIAEAVKGKLTVFADGGVRTGTDVFRMLALGADGVLIGRAFIYALATGQGRPGVERLLAIMEKDLRTNMVLTGVKSVRRSDRICWPRFATEKVRRCHRQHRRAQGHHHAMWLRT
jgi:L-lactate dehydrogenase (cytochrome)